MRKQKSYKMLSEQTKLITNVKNNIQVLEFY